MNNRIGNGSSSMLFVMKQVLSVDPSDGDDARLSPEALKILNKLRDRDSETPRSRNITWKALTMGEVAGLYKAFSGRYLFSTNSDSTSTQRGLSITSDWKNAPHLLRASAAKIPKYSRVGNALSGMLKTHYAGKPGADTALVDRIVDTYSKYTSGSRCMRLRDACTLANTLDALTALSQRVKDSRLETQRNPGLSLSYNERVMIEDYAKLETIVAASERYPLALIKLCEKIAKYLPSERPDTFTSVLDGGYSGEHLIDALEESDYCRSIFTAAGSDDPTVLSSKLRKTHRVRTVLNTFDSSTFSGDMIRKGAIVAGIATAPLMLGAFPIFSGIYFPIGVAGSVVGGITAAPVSAFSAGMTTAAVASGVGGTSNLIAGLKKRWSNTTPDPRSNPFSRFMKRFGTEKTKSDQIFKDASADGDLRDRDIVDIGMRSHILSMKETSFYRLSALLENNIPLDANVNRDLSRLAESLILTKNGGEYLLNVAGNLSQCASQANAYDAQYIDLLLDPKHIRRCLRIHSDLMNNPANVALEKYEYLKAMMLSMELLKLLVMTPLNSPYNSRLKEILEHVLENMNSKVGASGMQSTRYPLLSLYQDKGNLFIPPGGTLKTYL